MTIITCAHSRKRLVEWFKCRIEKCEKIAFKAWKSREPVFTFIAYSKSFTYPGTVLRSLQGFVFAFVPHDTKPNHVMVLKTVYHPKSKCVKEENERSIGITAAAN